MAFFVKPQSTAIKIVKPTAADETVKSTPPPRKADTERRQCRNVLIYGHCKFQDKGCIYLHPPYTDLSQPAPTLSSQSPKLTASAPAFVPPSSASPFPTAAPAPRSDSPAVNMSASPPASALTPQALNAPVFVPRTGSGFGAARKTMTSPPPASSLGEVTNGDPESPPVGDQGYVSAPENGRDPNSEASQYRQSQEEHQNGHQIHHQQEYSGYSDYDNYDYQTAQATDAMQGMEVADPSYYHPSQMEYHGHGYEGDPMEDSYYSHASVFLRQPLNYLLYTPTMPSELVRNATSSQFVPPSSELRQTLQERSETIRGVAPVGLTGIPEELQGYHTLVPLEPNPAATERRKLGNWHSTVYRAIRGSDGVPHVLRRVENFRMMHQAAFGPIESWSQIQHPNIVPVVEAFTTKSFNDHSLVVAYAYYPNAKTLFEAHVKPKPQPAPAAQTSGMVFYHSRHQQRQPVQQQQQQPQIPEQTLWSYIVQISSAMKKVHDRGLAVRMIDVTKILVTGQNRVRIGSCGVFDVLLYDNQQDLGYLQQEDLVMLGRLILILCTGNLSAPNSQNSMQKAIDIVKRNYSQDVQSLVLFLCSKMHKTADQVLEMIRGRILVEQEEATAAVDRLEGELMGELENARLVRLMIKFGFINDRPEFARDPRWSETGDRYIVKLFRDYVFHQVDENGNPLLDLTHVLSCLNKLDSGTDEKVMLVARDEQSCLVVSYKEIKACVSSAFDELARAKQGR